MKRILSLVCVALFSFSVAIAQETPKQEETQKTEKTTKKCCKKGGEKSSESCSKEGKSTKKCCKKSKK